MTDEPTGGGDTRVVCIYCAGLGQSKGEDCTRCLGTGLAEPDPPAPPRTGAGEERPPAEGEDGREPGSEAARQQRLDLGDGDDDAVEEPPKRRRRRAAVDPGFDVGDAPPPRRERKAAGKAICRDPDCRDHAAKRQGGRKCVETGRMIYPPMDEKNAVMLAAGLLNAISMGVSVIADAPVSPPTAAEAKRLADPIAPIVQRYLGSLGEHAALLVLISVLVSYGRDRWKEAQRNRQRPGTVVALRPAAAPSSPMGGE